jgi:hypothetical protein
VLFDFELKKKFRKLEEKKNHENDYCKSCSIQNYFFKVKCVLLFKNQTEELEQELIRLTDDLLQTKNTSLLSDFSLLIDKTLTDRSINCKNTIIGCLTRLNKFIPSK